MKLAPDVFWSMTLQEFQTALRGYQGGVGQPAAMTRTDLDALMQNFPDKAVNI